MVQNVDVSSISECCSSLQCKCVVMFDSLCVRLYRRVVLSTSTRLLNNPSSSMNDFAVTTRTQPLRPSFTLKLPCAHWPTSFDMLITRLHPYIGEVHKNCKLVVRASAATLSRLDVVHVHIPFSIFLSLLCVRLHKTGGQVVLFADHLASLVCLDILSFRGLPDGCEFEEFRRNSLQKKLCCQPSTLTRTKNS